LSSDVRHPWVRLPLVISLFHSIKRKKKRIDEKKKKKKKMKNQKS